MSTSSDKNGETFQITKKLLKMKVSIQIQAYADQLIVRAGKTEDSPHRGDLEGLFYSLERHALSFSHLSSHTWKEFSCPSGGKGIMHEAQI